MQNIKNFPLVYMNTTSYEHFPLRVKYNSEPTVNLNSLRLSDAYMLR